MKKYLSLAVIALALTACGDKPISTIEMNCAGKDIVTAVFADHINVTVDGQKIDLKQIAAASGSRYEATDASGLSFWNNGSEWTMSLGKDTTPISCTMKPAVQEPVQE